jgi:hypothetical protein
MDSRNIISLESVRSRRRQVPPVCPPAALGRAARSPASEPELGVVDYRMRMQQNLGAAAVVVVIVLLGTWLLEELRTYSRLQACLEAGHRNCAPMVARELPGQ